MVGINWADAAVQASVISSLGAIVAALIAAVCAALIGRHFAARKKLQGMLRSAVEDIAFLLVVEEEHCELHKEHTAESWKQRVRQRAQERGVTWSGRFTPGRVKRLSWLQEE